MQLKRINSAIDRVGRNDINENFGILERTYGKTAIDAQEAKTISEQAKRNSDNAVATSDDAMILAESVQNQFNQVVIEGDSSIEAAQARVSADATTYDTLKARLDAENAQVTQQLAQIEVDVRDFGALENTDATESIQSAINYVESLGGGTVRISGSLYYILANDPSFTGNYLRDTGGLALKNNVHLKMSPHTVLKALPTNQGQYQVIRIYNKQNVKITGGIIEGERNEHTGTTGEWGYGLGIHGGKNIEIIGTRFNDCWGDGINLQVYENEGSYISPENIYIDKVICHNNRRQGMSVEGALNLVVKDSVFSGTNGTAPSCGVDIEPWSNQNIARNITFQNCTFKDNETSGLLMMVESVSQINVLECIFKGNKDSEAHLKTISGVSDVTISGCTFDSTNNGDTSTGIYLQNGENFNVINNTFLECGFSTRILTSFPFAQLNNIVFSGNFIRIKARNNYSPFNIAQSVVNSNVTNNTFDFAGNTYDSIFELNGINTVFSNNIMIEPYRGINVRTNAVIENNKIHGAKLVAMTLWAGGSIIKDNVISGACQSNPSQTVIRLTTNANDSTIVNNTIYRDSLVPIEGTGKANAFLSADSASLMGLNIKLNTLVKSNDGTGFTSFFTGKPTNTNNVILDENGSSATTSALRPVGVRQGFVNFDTTLNKPIWWTGTSWVDSNGTTV